MAKKQEEKIKYSKVVASIVDEKLYFKDAIDWYCLKYLNATSERTFYIFLSIMSFIIVVFLYLTITSILPLKEKFPVLVRQSDSVNYYTTIKPLKPAKLSYNSNEAILRFLLINYVRNLFEHDYKTGNIDDLNNKLAKVKLYSTNVVYQKYRNDFNVISAEMFNKKVDQKVALKSFSFIKTKEKNGKDKLLNYLFSRVPSEAEITYRLIFTNYSTGEQKITDGKIHLTFKYESISYNNIKKEFTKPVLVITDYRIMGDGKDSKNTDNSGTNDTKKTDDGNNIENNNAKTGEIETNGNGKADEVGTNNNTKTDANIGDKSQSAGANSTNNTINVEVNDKVGGTVDNTVNNTNEAGGNVSGSTNTGANASANASGITNNTELQTN